MPDRNAWISEMMRADTDQRVWGILRSGVFPNVPYQFRDHVALRFQVWLGIGFYEQMAGL